MPCKASRFCQISHQQGSHYLTKNYNNILKKTQQTLQARSPLYSFQFMGLTLATGFGVGLGPKMPGTYGSMVGILFGWGLLKLPFSLQITIFILSCALAIWSIHVADKYWKTRDNAKIVIDEILGMGLVLLGTIPDLKHGILAFMLFRLFDIMKIPPIRQIDQLSHTLTNPFFASAAVLLDDLGASIQSLLILWSLDWLHHWLQ
jgi:phosphatidylglycerophosphatase A